MGCNTSQLYYSSTQLCHLYYTLYFSLCYSFFLSCNCSISCYLTLLNKPTLSLILFFLSSPFHFHSVFLLLYSVFIPLYSVCILLYSIFIPLYSVCILLYSVFIPLYSVCILLYSIFILLYSVFILLYSVLNTLGSDAVVVVGQPRIEAVIPTSKVQGPHTRIHAYLIVHARSYSALHTIS